MSIHDPEYIATLLELQDQPEAAATVRKVLRQRNEGVIAIKAFLALDPSFTRPCLAMVKQLADEESKKSGMAHAVYLGRRLIEEIEGKPQPTPHIQQPQSFPSHGQPGSLEQGEPQ